MTGMSLPIAVSENVGGAAGAPFFKLRNIGDKFVGALGSDPDARESRRQVRETTQVDGKTVTKMDGDGKPVFATKADGKPKYEEVMHFAAVAGSTAVTGPKDDPTPVEPLEHYRFSVNGYVWGKVIDARRNLPPIVTPEGQIIAQAGQSTCQDIYTFTLTHKSASVENAAEEAKLREAGLVVEEDNGYKRVILPNKEAELKRVEIRLELGLELRATRKEVGVQIQRANAENPAEVGAVQAAFQMWQDKVWVRPGQDGVSDDEQEGDVQAAPAAQPAAQQPAAQPAPDLDYEPF